jgi:diaminohydroxyphosphoribosylaminopyrimidine deaminase/5-amino-6-(5-phosphoribosylamino)uracil reductase
MRRSDEYYMKRALTLAEKGRGQTNPNPLVGALVVKKGKIIGEGYHRKAGFPHAEVEAIRSAESDIVGSTLYVTLEPCTTFGRTPPCTDLIITSRIREVVIATRDPNPAHRGRGILALKKTGITVRTGILEREAQQLNSVFTKFIQKKTPFVTVKIAQSLDGKIATATGESQWITGIDSRRFVHKLRSEVDAVLVGATTVAEDNPLLTNRLYRPVKKQPIKIVLDSRLRISPTSRIFSKNSPQKVIIATTTASPRARRRLFEKHGATVLLLGKKQGVVSLKALMRTLARMQITHVLVEGGGEILGSLFKEKLVDNVFFFISPKIIGGDNAPTSVMGEGIKRLRFARRLRDVTITRFEDDILIEGRLK